MVISRIWEFHLGYLFHKLNIRKLKKNSLFSSILLISLITAIFSPVSTPRIVSTLFILFVSGTLISLKIRDIAIIKILQVIGDRSYSLYLFHMPLLYLAKFTPLLYGDQREVPTMFAVVLTFFLAEISYRKVEFRFSRSAS
jgi:peptidoglycan/LPS O-acetylase OafA/YrhL